MPDATPTSTAPRSPARRNKLWLAIQIAITAIIVWYVGKGLAKPWRDFRAAPHVDTHISWWLIIAGSAVMLAGYAVLIETWRRIVNAWGLGPTFHFADAARIWFVSSLVRYLPYNFVFQLGAVAELSRRERISPLAATGASLINQVVNIAGGFIIALVVGFRAMDALSGGYAILGAVVAAALLLGVLVLPLVLPVLTPLLERVTGRSLAFGQLPYRAIVIALIGNLIAWILYGVAYRLFAIGVLGTIAGTMSEFVAIYAAAYVIGYLAFVMPAGAVVREGIQVQALTMLGVASSGQAGLVAISARLWVTILEVAPALIMLSLARRSRRASPGPSRPDGPNP